MSVSGGGISGVIDPAKLSAADLVEIARHPEKYEAILATFQAKHDELTALIEKAGPAAEIPRLHAEATEARSQAVSMQGKAAAAHGQALQDADDLLIKAKAEAERIVKEAEEHAAKVTGDAEAKAADATDQFRRAEETSNSLAEQAIELRHHEDACNDREGKLIYAEHAHAARVARFNAAIAEAAPAPAESDAPQQT